MKNTDKIDNLLPRPPITVVMGHVDHGKTTLLDYIRKTNVVAKEAGGITQSIGAYEINHNGKRITFIDTPGHEAFSKMRERGAKVADLGILVVAADEGVKPQTKEAIKILNESKTSFVVAINRIDKSSADVEKVKQELMQEGVLLEGFGGSVSWQAISAKTGEGVIELLDLILLAAELENFVYNPRLGGRGVVIESKIDSRRGVSAIVIVKDGVLKIGDEITTPSVAGKVKILENFIGERTDELAPSSPALILGFENLPRVGEEFFSGHVELTVIESVPKKEEKRNYQISDNKSAKVNVLLKADVAGSLEVLVEAVENLPDAKIVGVSVGEITDGDVKLAASAKAIILGFNSKISKPAEILARAQNVKIVSSGVIYDLLKKIGDEISGAAGPKINAELEILAVFSFESKKQIVGGRVVFGELKNQAAAEITRNGEVIGEGKILNLQHNKKDVRVVEKGKECGLLFEADRPLAVGDRLITG